MRWWVAVLFLLSLAAAEARAHGGAYRGPMGEVPHGWRDPKDPQPPGPDAPPRNPDEPADPPDPKPPVKGPGQATPGSQPRRRAEVMTFENWLFWWEYNKDAILLARTDARAPDVSEAARKKAVAALEQTLAHPELHPDIRAGAVIALARAEPTRERIPRLLALAAGRAPEEKIVRESALLALGLTGIVDPTARKALLDVVRDTKDENRARCFAMISLGLLKDDHDDVRKALEDRVAADERFLDVPNTALFALGLVGSERSVPTLVEWIGSGRAGEKKLRDIERSWAVAALGRIGHPEALPAIWMSLRRNGRYTRRSAAIALGRLVPATAGETAETSVKLLAKYHRSEEDLSARSFAVITMGRIAADPRTPRKAREMALTFLDGAWMKVNRTTDRPYVALARGLSGGAFEWRKVIREDLAARKGDKTALGASAVALGLLRDAESVPVLLKILADRGENRHLRRAAATGLGLIGGPKANEAILASLADREDRALRVNTGTSAGLLAPPEAAESLLKLFDNWKASQFVLGSAALSLGWVGDDRAIDRMVTILEPKTVNGQYPDLTRAMVTVALGRLLDRREHRSLHRLSQDLNYRALVPALDEILTIL